MPFGFDMEGDNWSAFCAVHRPSRKTKPKRLALEFDMKMDPVAPSPTPPAHSTPSPVADLPANGATPPDESVTDESVTDNRPGMASEVRFDPTVDELLKSTRAFPPLKDLIKMKRKRDRDVLAGRADASTSWTKEQDLQIFSLISTINERLGKAPDLASLYDVRDLSIRPRSRSVVLIGFSSRFADLRFDIPGSDGARSCHGVSL